MTQPALQPASVTTARLPTGMGLLVSLALHGAVLAGIGGWDGPADEVSPAQVTIDVVMAAAEAAKPEVTPEPPPPPSLPPAPPPAATVPPPASAQFPARTTSRATASKPRPIAITPAPTPPPQPESGGAMTGADTPPPSAPAGEVTGASSSIGTPQEADRPALPAPGNPAPPYPFPARRAAREGRTTLLVTVGEDGRCESVVIEKTSGTPSLDEAALHTVQDWRFTPARQNGRAVAATIRVPVVFKLTAREE